MSAALQTGALARRGFLRAVSGLVLLVSARGRAAQPVQVGIDNFTFSPPTLALGAGGTVTWVNHDDIPHSIVCPALGLKSSVLDTDQSFSRRFDQPGSFDYFCGIHPHMKGKLVVSG
jgi:plastocyanin